MGTGFERERLSEEEIARLKELARLARGDILKMTTLAGSGHPGGSMSSVDIYLTLYSCANVDPRDPEDPDRDRIIISHGHTSPGVYAALGRLGFFDVDQAIATFRKTGSMFEGHVERHVPGVEWSTGNLGQGLAAGCGFALAAKLTGRSYHTFVVMSDAEQAKGMVAEARRFAKKYGLTDITVIVDYNHAQIDGRLEDVMPQNIKGGYRADGWKVLEADGHDFGSIYQALREAVSTHDAPVVILAETTIGKGVSFMEGDVAFHGKALTLEQYRRAMEELGLEDDLDRYRRMREEFRPSGQVHLPLPKLDLKVGRPRTYDPEADTDNRSAFGRALLDIADANPSLPMAVLDCDLAPSVRTEWLAEKHPGRFFEAGVQEHSTAIIAGALSVNEVLTFFADFGVFGVDETFNQHRLSDINGANLKLVCTHLGLDVGEDGKTHQCTDYLGVLRNLFGFKIIIPADPNQTDRAVRYVARTPGNFLVGMGRSKTPVITDEEGRPLFGEGYEFEYGRVDLVREGEDGAVLTMGPMVYRAVKAWEMLKQRGVEVKILNVPCPVDLDRDALKEAAGTGLVVTYEDHHIDTGLGASVALALAEEGLSPKFVRMGIRSYGGSGKPDELFSSQGLSPEDLVRVVLESLELRRPY